MGSQVGESKKVDAKEDGWIAHTGITRSEQIRRTETVIITNE